MARAALPNWPAAMRRETAASYCDMTPTAFEREVLVGSLPNPIMLGGAERWYRRGLDEALERLTGGGVEDWRSKAKLHVER